MWGKYFQEVGLLLDIPVLIPPASKRGSPLGRTSLSMIQVIPERDEARAGLYI